MKWIIIVVLTLSVVFCIGQNQHVKVVIHSIDGYGAYEDFARSAAVSLENVLNSEEFKQRVLNGVFLRTNGLSNQELYNAIMLAHEEQGPGGQDSVVDLRLRTINLQTDGQGRMNACVPGSTSGTIGIDGGGDGVVATCPQWISMWAGDKDVGDLAGHYAHEYMHILGFNHYKFLSRQPWREKTFVYIIGNWVAELSSKPLTPVK